MICKGNYLNPSTYSEGIYCKYYPRFGSEAVLFYDKLLNIAKLFHFVESIVTTTESYKYQLLSLLKFLLKKKICVGHLIATSHVQP